MSGVVPSVGETEDLAIVMRKYTGLDEDDEVVDILKLYKKGEEDVYKRQTCWWSLDGTKTGDIEWGLLDLNGNRIDIWYALRNVANTMNNDYTITDEITAEFSTDTEMIYECFKNGDTYQIPYWAFVKMRTSNTGTSSDIAISGVDVKNAVRCV